jgi:hypothetical protein
MIESVDSHKWPTDSYPIADVMMPASELASRLGVELRSWWSDGFGQATGFAFRTSSNRVFAVEQREINNLAGKIGITIDADASDIVAVGQEALIVEVAASLGMDREVFLPCLNIESNAANFIAEYYPEKHFPSPPT